MMQEVQVLKIALLDQLKANRGKHVSEFEEAHRNWRQEVSRALGKAHDDAMTGRAYKTHFNLPEPKSYEKEYDRAIAMVYAELRDHLTLSRQEFIQLWLDEWGWKETFTTTTSMYR